MPRFMMLMIPGTFPAEGVVVQATVPAGATFVSASGGGRESGGTVRWVLGPLAPGEYRVYRDDQEGEALAKFSVTAGQSLTVTWRVP